MEGFFSQKEIRSISRPTGRSLSCISCGLYKDCITGKMLHAYGKFKKKILIIGEAPGEREDQVNKPWQGKAGKFLADTLQEFGVSLFYDCASINSVNCRPKDKKGKNRAPTNFELDCCRKYVMRAIDENKPALIILLGKSAVYSVIGHRWKHDKLGEISRWRGMTIPDQDLKAWVCPTFHPSYIMRTEDKYSKHTGMAVEEVIWRNDLQQAIEKLKTSLPVWVEPKINYIEDLSVLPNLKFYKPVLKDYPSFVFDYETTGVKPHAPGHRIVCSSIAINENEVYVFMMPKTKREREPFVELLINPAIGKIAANMKFEIAWTKVRLRVNIKRWIWDTMIFAHIQDNRPKYVGLKFQVYINFGIMDYSSEVDPWLKTTNSKNSNSFNKILELIKTENGRQKLLKYCAYDSICEYRLAIKQMETLLPF